MAKVTVEIMVDEVILRKATELLRELGLDLSTAVEIFLRQTIREGALPVPLCKWTADRIHEWDPDFTKAMPCEAERIKHAENGPFYNEEDIRWDHLESFVASDVHFESSFCLTEREKKDKSNFAFYPIRTLTLLRNYEVLAHFHNGDVKRYDFERIIHEFASLKPLADNYDLFKQIHCDVGWYGVIWNDDLDLASEELWYDGVDAESPFKGLLSFEEAEERWNLREGTLMTALFIGKLLMGIDVMRFEKQYVITKSALEREFGKEHE